MSESHQAQGSNRGHVQQCLLMQVAEENMLSSEMETGEGQFRAQTQLGNKSEASLE